MKKSAIYKITCTLDGKVYIGQSVQPDRRWGEHLRTLKKNEHANLLLQRAWNKHGGESFTHSILEWCDINEVDDREKYWIQNFRSNTLEFGYNLDGGGNLNKSHHEITKEKMRRIAKKSGRWQGENHPLFGVKLTEQEKIERKKYLVAYWSNHENKLKFKQKKKLNNNIHVAIEAKRVKIVQLSLGGEFIAEYDSMADAAKTNKTNLPHISDCCNNKRKSAGGFIWVLKENYLKENYKINPSQLSLNKKLRIAKLTLEGDIIAVYNYSELRNLNGVSTSKIMCCVKGTRNIHAGFKWKEFKE